MRFTYSTKREWHSAAQRSVITGTRGMVTSSQHLASLAGYNVLKKGGNAIDAAVAMLATLNVVEPQSVGIGGDAFALIYFAEQDKLIGMNASGRAPYAASLDWFKTRGIEAIPERGILPVTVPGALLGWAQAVERYGKLSLPEIFDEAVMYAEDGFPVTEVIAGDWNHAADLLRSTKPAASTYLIDGKAPYPGQVFRNRTLSKTFRTILGQGVGTFYQGEIGQSIVNYSNENNGILSKRDLKDHTTSWVDPISIDYRGFRVVQLPPNGQGVTVLQMLKILEGYDISNLKPNSAEHAHLLIEAKKAAFYDRDRYITDPESESIPIQKLLSSEYADIWRKKISIDTAIPPSILNSTPGRSDTVYVAAVDEQRNAVSFISSIYMHFGSGLVAGNTGIILQNRGHSFSLDPRHFNRIMPHKRTCHTIIPGMVFKNGQFLMAFGVVGGDMQPQGQVQFLLNLIDFNMNLQEAVDAPRIRHFEDRGVSIEKGIDVRVAEALAAKGHQIDRSVPATNEWGGAQAIYYNRKENVLLGASDRRKDGCAIGY